MTVSHVWLFRKNTDCWHSSLLSHELLGTIQSELSTNLKLSPRPSFTPIQLQVYILELLHSHFIKLQPRLDSKRNRRRLEMKPVATRRNNYQTLPIVYSHRASNDIHATLLLLNTIITLLHSLQTVCCRFIYLHEENANADDTENWSRLLGSAGNPMTTGTQQPISAIAAGDSAVTPPSTPDNGGQPALRKRRRVV